MILGAHVSISGGVQNAPLNGKKIGCQAIQLFSKNQQQWAAKPFTEENVAGFKQNLRDLGIQIAVIHGSYLINLCAPEMVNLKKSVAAFTDELERAEALGIPYVVTHPGSHLGKGEDWGVERIAEGLNEIHQQKPGLKVITLLETTAGQGTNVGYRFEQIAAIREKIIQKERVGVCADSCHMYSAGYDLKDAKGYETTWQQFAEIIGLQHLLAFHLNDTKKKLGSRVDRHDHIGQGELGLEPFRRLLHDARFEKIPGLLETPGEEQDFRRNLQVLRSLASK